MMKLGGNVDKYQFNTLVNFHYFQIILHTVFLYFFVCKKVMDVEIFLDAGIRKDVDVSH